MIKINFNIMNNIPSSNPANDEAKVHFNKALELISNQDYTNAEIELEIAQKKAPERLSILTNLASVKIKMNKIDEAFFIIDKTLSLYPNDAITLLNKGFAHERCGHYESAALEYKKAININPHYTEAHINLGTVLMELMLLDDALKHFDYALSLTSTLPEAQLNKSFVLLLKGNLNLGFLLYEWRLKIPPFNLPYHLVDRPTWTPNTSLNNKIIYIYAEQGLGDVINFSRFLINVKSLGAVIIFQVPMCLFGLYAENSLIDVLLTDGDDIPEYDYHCPLLSLPYLLNIDANLIASSYIKTHPAQSKVKYWNQILGKTKKFRIGVNWNGSKGHRNDHNRSMGVEDFFRYLPNGFEYICLKKELSNAEFKFLKKHDIAFYADELEDFSDTAALCDLMDLVISVDTSVAHLSASLGKPTWILLPYLPDWRWMLDDSTSPWYPTVKLYRQGANRNWADVLQIVRRDLWACKQ